jgi:hypothetical protein
VPVVVESKVVFVSILFLTDKQMGLTVSPNPAKKYRYTFSDGKHTDFGSKGMDDYTKTKDKEQRARYLTRHRANEDWNNPRSAGSLSKHILWGDSTSIQTNLASFKRKFAGRI